MMVRGRPAVEDAGRPDGSLCAPDSGAGGTHRMTEQTMNDMTQRYCVNTPQVHKEPLSRLNVHGPRQILGITNFMWPANAPVLEFVGGRLVARDFRFDLTHIDSRIVEVDTHPVGLVNRVNGTWGLDGAHLITGNPRVDWAADPGADLGPHQVCIEITAAVQADVRRLEIEHVRDFVLAWTLTVGVFVEALPTSQYPSAGDALLAVADGFTRTGRRHLVPPGSRTDPRAWTQHLRTRATQLAEQSTLRDSRGSHTPLSYTARLDHGNGQARIILNPVMPPATQAVVVDVGSLPD